MDQTFLAKVKGSDPDEFVFITLNLAEGGMRHMSAPMTEEQVRAELTGNGMPEAEVNEKIFHARANPA